MLWRRNELWSGLFLLFLFIVTILIMIVGHGINLFMGVLGAFVHPLRLTFVEFYKNAGFEDGGRAFEPLKRVKK